MIFQGFFCHIGFASLPSKMNFHFFKSVDFSSSYGISSFKNTGFLEKKIEFLFYFQKIIILEENN